MKQKYNKILLLLSIFIISILSMISIENSSLLSNIEGLFIKDMIFILIGFILIYLINKLNLKHIYKYSFIIYMFINILLLLTLIYGENINGASCWLRIGPLSFEPSEFMKISLIIELSKLLNNKEKRTIKEEFIVILKAVTLTIIPSILVFLEPDTGAVIIYIIILISMLFISNIRKTWLISLISIILISISIFIYIYLTNKTLFNKIFNESLTYRIKRITEWKLNEGMQLENSLITISKSNIKGNKLKNIPIYIPESESDFIFSVFSNTFGLIGSIILIILYILINYIIMNTIKYQNNKTNKYILFSILSIFIFSEIQNIGMTLGLLPIMGITLPFMSYGGSSIITNFILIGLITKLNTSNYVESIDKKRIKK